MSLHRVVSTETQEDKVGSPSLHNNEFYALIRTRENYQLNIDFCKAHSDRLKQI